MEIIRKKPKHVCLEYKIEIVLLKGNIKKPKELSEKALKNGKEQRTTGHIVSEGNRHYIEICESPLPGTNCTLGMVRDITKEEEIDRDLKNAEHELEQLQTERRFQ